MISFSCSHCSMKLKVKPEFAGRSSKCPTCKHPLVVPLPDTAQAFVPQGQIDGTVSSVHQAGVEGGVTLGQGKAVQDLLSRKGKERYVIQNEIARGGMGVVLLGLDRDIRREVAIKFMLKDSDPKQKSRFIEEAQITGQLEHPNIVPIHELGLDAQKRLFFSMKMVRGRSLKDVLDMIRENPRQAEKEYTLGRLLNIFVNVCNGLAYAHSRGVVHRDLKPANIMTGDFGEVYVMDWGLAKVVDRAGAEPVGVIEAAGFANFMKSKSPAPADSGTTSSSGSKVSTSGRQDEADLTQEGSILGTPVYMPPEQAMGEISQIDQRSDIYSLGAILYEMLALQPPIDKEGGHMAILIRVSQGEMVPPEQRNLQRTIPRELSAIAMKALAKEPKDRYQNVEELRKDIERFQEGRSVSAKEDTRREMLLKFVKRNKGFSAGVAMTLLVLVASLVLVTKALLETRQANAIALQAQKDTQKAQKEKEERTKQAIPAFVRAASVLANEVEFKKAMEQVEFALENDPTYAEARLLKGQVLIAQKDWAAGRTELEQYMRQRSKDADAKKLVDLVAKGKADDPVLLFALAEVLQQQKMSGLAFHLLQDVQETVKAREPLLALYRKQIEAAWPGLGGWLTLDQTGQLNLNFGNKKQVAGLLPLKGMQINVLNLTNCDGIADLTPLRGMPLTSLNLFACRRVADLTPLQGMPLTHLGLSYCDQVRDLTPLQGMPLTALQLAYCNRITDLSPLQGMNLTDIYLTPKNITKGMDVLRQMKSLKNIWISYSDRDKISSAEFWKRYDAGEFNK